MVRKIHGEDVKKRFLPVSDPFRQIENHRMYAALYLFRLALQKLQLFQSLKRFVRRRIRHFHVQRILISRKNAAGNIISSRNVETKSGLHLHSPLFFKHKKRCLSHRQTSALHPIGIGKQKITWRYVYLS